MFWLFNAARISERGSSRCKASLLLPLLESLTSRWSGPCLLDPSRSARVQSRSPPRDHSRRNFERSPEMGGDAVCSNTVGSALQKGTSDNNDASRKNGEVADTAQYSILREGEADILLHGNDVFYNKAQIVNRDISIAVIRAFIAKREEEHSAEVAKKLNGGTLRSQAAHSELQTGGSRPSSCSNDAAGEGPSGGVSFVKPLRVLEVQWNALRCTQASEEQGCLFGTHVLQNCRGINGTGSMSAMRDATQCEFLNGSVSSVGPHLDMVINLISGQALAASGLRALRYAKEIEGVGVVVATDNDKVAFEACERNIKLNGPVAALKVEAKHADARVFMLTHEKDFDVVDLDPYGSPSIFLDSAVQTVADGGLLLCTATDMAVLCGNNGEVCYSKYGSYPLRGKYCHEMALRILLACIESHANRYKRYIVPLVSLSVDFYVRVFVRIYTSAKMIKATPSKLSYVYQCVGCDSYQFQPVGCISYKNNSTRYMPANGPTILPDCKECGKHFNMGGPMWAAPIHDPGWISSTLTAATAMKKRYPAFDKLHSILTAVSEELLDVPLYLNLHSMSGTLKCTPPSAALFRSAVANAGYRISSSHANPLGVKTDAPMDILWDIMRCWVKAHPVKPQAAETPGSVILSKEPKLEANFMKVNSALSRAQVEGVARFLPNPEDYWGPKPRAGRHRTNKQVAAAGPLHAGNVHVRENVNGDMEIEVKRQKQEDCKEPCLQDLDLSGVAGSS